MGSRFAVSFLENVIVSRLIMKCVVNTHIRPTWRVIFIRGHASVEKPTSCGNTCNRCEATEAMCKEFPLLIEGEQRRSAESLYQLSILP